MKLACLLLCCGLFSPAWSQEFRLDGEKRETYGLSGPVPTFIAYAYDDAGKRLSRRAYNGADTDAPALGVTSYHYSATGRLEREVLTTGTDTLSDIAYFYGLLPKPIRIEVKGSKGVVRYCDSLSYNDQGRLLNETRIVQGEKRFGRRYAYDGVGRRIADTLFETDSVSSNRATQAIAYLYNEDGSVNGERHSRLAEGAWYAEKGVAMTYSRGMLSAVVNYIGEGAGRITLDSLSIARDASGNRVEDRRFAAEGGLAEKVQYFWSAIPVSVRWAPRKRNGNESMARGGIAWRTSGGVQRHDLRGRILPMGR